MCHKYQFNINFSSLLHILQFVDAFRNAIAHEFMTVRFSGLQWKLHWRLVGADKLSISLSRWHGSFHIPKCTFDHGVQCIDWKIENAVCQTFPKWIEVLSIIAHMEISLMQICWTVFDTKPVLVYSISKRIECNRNFSGKFNMIW